MIPRDVELLAGPELPLEQVGVAVQKEKPFGLRRGDNGR